MLTILGLILFLRMGYVVGNAGLIGAIVIICLANAISLITGLSLSSIATNMHVKTGGTYYMIARTLGLEIGGAIGIPLYLSQAVSVAFYVIGFSEAFGAALSRDARKTLIYGTGPGVRPAGLCGRGFRPEDSVRGPGGFGGGVGIVFFRRMGPFRGAPAFASRDGHGIVLAGVCGIFPGRDGNRRRGQHVRGPAGPKPKHPPGDAVGHRYHIPGLFGHGAVAGISRRSVRTSHRQYHHAEGGAVPGFDSFRSVGRPRCRPRWAASWRLRVRWRLFPKTGAVPGVLGARGWEAPPSRDWP